MSSETGGFHTGKEGIGKPATLSDTASITARSEEDEGETLQLAVAESTAVRWSKRLVLVVLLVAAVLSVIATYFVVDAAEEKEFKALVSVD